LNRLMPAILLLAACAGPCRAQDHRIMFRAEDGGKIRGIPGGPVDTADSLQGCRLIRELIVDLRKDGYLAASADSLVPDSAGVEVWVYRGPRFEWGKLSMDSINGRVLRKAGVRSSAFSGKPLKPARLAAAQSRIINWYENNGYPFAGIVLEDLRFEGDGVSGRMEVHPGDRFLIDTLHVKGEIRLDRRYVSRLLGIRPGDVYNERRIAGIGDRIRETSFIQEIRPAEFEFFRGDVDVYTYLQKTRASQFNGIVGVFPNHEQTGKLFVTGDLHLYLVNSFGKGESFRFAWRALQPLTQELELTLDWPYVFGTQVGVGLNFSLLKQDTSWLTVNPVAELKFFLGGSSYLDAFYDYSGSSLISTAGLENVSSLPTHADVSTSLYGLGIRYRSLDYLFNPGRGWDIYAREGIGTRRIRRNPALPDAVYEKAGLSTTRIRGWATVAYYQPLGGRFCLHLENRTGYIGGGSLFENELFRLGGLHTLRGVDENSIFASLYSLGTVEPRFRFEQNSNFFLFLDGGYYEKDAGGEFSSDFPLGFGAGVNLSTKAGIFSLVYALGKQFDNPVNIGRAKIHFGYLNRF
jgi:outer membrane protein assembly factor BamA